MKRARKQVCLVTATEATVIAFLKEQIRVLDEHYDVSLVVHTAKQDFAEINGLAARVIPLAIERNISLLSDLRALIGLTAIFRRERFDVVHSVTPKAGLLAMLAGRMAGIGLRIHTFTGQVWATRSGFSRWLLKSMDRLLASCATHLLADSHSQRDFILAQGVTYAGKLRVLASGSICGVDTVRFSPDETVRREIRKQFGIADGETLFLFLGRLNPDKGVLDLAQAFNRLPETSRLLFVGPDESGMQARIEGLAADHPRVHFVSYTDKPEAYMCAADVFCLPSYREGFGSVVIEAAACGIPAIASRIYGLTDAVEEGRSGLLFPPRNIDALADCMLRLNDDKVLRSAMGTLARQRAEKDFSSTRVTQAWLEYYDALL